MKTYTIVVLLVGLTLIGCATSPTTMDPFEPYQEGRNLYDQGRYDEAIQAFDRALAVDPNFVDAYVWKGNAYDKIGATESAINAYQNALRIRPDHPEANFYLAEIYHKQGRCQEPKDLYRKVLAVQPTHYNAQQALAAVERNNCRSAATQPEYEQRSEFSGGGRALREDEW